MLTINYKIKTDEATYNSHEIPSFEGISTNTSHEKYLRQRPNCLSFVYKIKSLFFVLGLMTGLCVPAYAQFSLTVAPTKDNQLTIGSTNNHGANRDSIHMQKC